MFSRLALLTGLKPRFTRRTFAGVREVTPSTRRNNMLLAFTLLAFIGGVYYTAINKMKQVS
jgi:hypothetical protein